MRVLGRLCGVLFSFRLDEFFNSVGELFCLYVGQIHLIMCIIYIKVTRALRRIIFLRSKDESFTA